MLFTDYTEKTLQTFSWAGLKWQAALAEPFIRTQNKFLILINSCLLLSPTPRHCYGPVSFLICKLSIFLCPICRFKKPTNKRKPYLPSQFHFSKSLTPAKLAFKSAEKRTLWRRKKACHSPPALLGHISRTFRFHPGLQVVQESCTWEGGRCRFLMVRD